MALQSWFTKVVSFGPKLHGDMHSALLLVSAYTLNHVVLNHLNGIEHHFFLGLGIQAMQGKIHFLDQIDSYLVNMLLDTKSKRLPRYKT